MDKLTLAHEYAKISISAMLNDNPDSDINFKMVAISAFELADAMFEEAEKREKEEAAKKRIEIQKLLNADNTFIEREGQHFDDVNWQPDWSQAPDDAVACAMDEDGWAWWYRDIPEKSYIKWNGDDICFYPNHNYTGDWRNSLRIRPSSK